MATKFVTIGTYDTHAAAGAACMTHHRKHGIGVHSKFRARGTWNADTRQITIYHLPLPWLTNA